MNLRSILRASVPAATALLLSVLLVQASDGAPTLFPWESVRATSVPSPSSVLGFELGERMVAGADALRYLDTLAASSNRVRVFAYARSHEGRPLRYAVISSPDNLAHLQESRLAVQRLASPSGLSQADAESLVRKTPVFVWLAYSVHGDEHSSTEAALAVAWHLASGDDDRTRRILDGAVVILDPLQNPDGRERFLHSYLESSGRAPVTDPAAAEHDEPWPSGRYNHDLFDMNRDWFFLTQPEVRGKVAAFLAWRPQVFVDFHEMGTDQTYYFAPPARPINPNVGDEAMKWFRIIGEGNARLFDSLGFEYFTREVFDLFYPGYGDSWPTLSGAVGMTYEEAGAQGLAIEKKDGGVLTLGDAMRRHIASSLATLETAASHREEILRDYHAARKKALDDSPGGVKALVIPAESQAGGAERLARLLVAQGIQVERAGEAFSARASAEPGSAAEARRFPEGSFIAPLAQPARRLLTALFERDPSLDERFVHEAMERRRLHEDPPFYDVTSWSLPLAMNLPVFQAVDMPHVASTPLSRRETIELPGHAQPPPGFDPWPPPIDAQEDPDPEGAPPALSRATVAYLIPPSGNGALAAFASLLKQEDLAVHVAAKSFTLNGRAFPPGTAVLKVSRNPESLHAAVAAAASKYGASVESASTGLSDDGIDLGSSSVVRVKLPTIATVYGEPASPTSVGWLDYVLGERYGLNVVPVRAKTLVGDADLRRYDVIVLPDGRPADYRDAFGKKGLDRLRDWIEAGGTMVTIKGASAFAASPEVAWTSSRIVRKPRSGAFSPAPETSGTANAAGTPTPRATAGTETAADRDPNAAEGDSGSLESPDAVPGAILRVLLEPSSPLAFGYGSEIPVLITSNLVFSLSKEGANAGVFAPASRLRVGGFLWKESIDLLQGKPYVFSEKIGRGTVVLFADDPDFRGGWDGLNRMLLNAVLLVPAFEP